MPSFTRANLAILNKSEAIREILREMPAADPDKVRKLLASRGVKVNINLIYQVRNRIGGVQADTRPPITIALEQIMAVKAIAKQVGGIEKLKTLVKALETIST